MSTSWKTIRVFISSTFRDMQAERDHLVRFVFPKLREELIPFRIHLIDVDLRWGVTSEQNALGVCREVIDNCHPRFMGMLGGRYGWVPDGQDKSITADEIHYGVLSRDAAKRGHAFFYFRDPKATEEIVESSPGDFLEPHDTEVARKLAALKQAIIDANLPVFIYPAQWDPTQKRLTKLEEFGNRVHDDLFQSLKDDPDPDLAAHFDRDTEKDSDPITREFAEEAEQLESFIEERTEHYEVGSRQALLNEMTAFATSEGTPNIFVLTGEPGSGKSAMLAKFSRSLDQSYEFHNSSFIIHHFVGASTGSTDLRRTLRRLCHELARTVGNTETLPLDIKELITHFQKLLAEAASRRRVILVFDALNQFDATDGAHWLNWLPRPNELPPGVRIVASVIAPADGQPEHQTLAILRTRPGTRMEKLEPLTEADTLAVIEGSLRRYAKRLSPEQLAALLAKPAGRLPLYVLTALEELRTLGTYEEITERIRTLPGDARELFGWILTERLAHDPGFRDREGRPCGAALVEKFAACLGVSRHGLSPAEITALLDPGDPLGNVAALLRLLRPYLMRRGELLDFYHGQFREAAGAAHLDTPEKQCAAHQSVATCLQAFADPHRDGQCRDATPHALSELPHHQTRAEAWPALIATLENIFFLEAKVSHGMAFDLAEDFTAAGDALPPEHAERLRLLNEALRRDIHFIARHANDYPQALFQCLWNSCWWYDCAETLTHCAKDAESAMNHARPTIGLHQILERWKQEQSKCYGARWWVRSLRPPEIQLGAGCLSVFRGHGSLVTCAVYSPDGRRIASGAADHEVRIWQASTGRELAILHGHTDQVTSIAFSPDGRLFASASRDHTVRIWDAESWCVRKVITKHQFEDGWIVNSLAFSPDGRFVLGGTGGMAEGKTSLQLWDIKTGESMADLRGNQSGGIAAVAFSPDGRLIAASNFGPATVRLVEKNSGRETAVLQGHTGGITSVAFSPDGRTVASASKDRTVRLWDSSSGDQLAVLSGHSEVVSGVCFSPDGKLVVSGSADKLLIVWNTQTKAKIGVLKGHTGQITSVMVSPDGNNILSGSFDSTVRVWNLSFIKSQRIPVVNGHGARINSLCFSPDGSTLATGSDDHTVRLWSTKLGLELAAFRRHKNAVGKVMYSPDGTCILSAEKREFLTPQKSRYVLRFWKTKTMRQVAVLRGHTDSITDFSFSPDGKYALSGSADHTARVWDVKKRWFAALLFGRQAAVLQHRLGVTCVAFSPDGGQAVTGSVDGTARLWFTKSLPVFDHGNGFRVWSIAFSPDGNQLFTGAGFRERCSVKVWDLPTRQCLHEYHGTADAVSVSLGKTALSSHGDRGSVSEGFQLPAMNGLVSWFPAPLGEVVACPTGYVWAGSEGKHLHLLRLEGI